MGRISTFIGLLVTISCASALSTTVSPSPLPTPMPTTSMAPAMTTTIASTTVAPVVSPSPDVPFFPESDYNVTTNGQPNGTICIRMVGNITLQIRYPRNEDGKVMNDTLQLDVSGRAAVDRTKSNCTNTSQVNGNGMMNLHWRNPENATDYNLIFHFEENKDSWALNKIEFQFAVYDNSDFENYTKRNEFKDTLTATEKDTVFSNEFERSYRCDSQQRNTLDVLNTTQLMITLTTTDWQVQAFAFPEGRNFTHDRRCTADISSSKIVPIAVGAALAGLVVVVLVAYLIGRFKNRKQNSYEALS